MSIANLDASPYRVSKAGWSFAEKSHSCYTKTLKGSEEVPRTILCPARPGVICDLEKPGGHSGILTSCGGVAGRKEGREARLMGAVTLH